MMELITKEKFYELMEEYSEYIFWQKYEDISENLLQILKEDIYKNENSYDILTPFKEGGKDWLFEYLYKYQPRTGKILKENSKLFGGVDLDTKLEYTKEGELGNTFLGLECSNTIIEIERDFYGNNLCDKEENKTISKEINRYHFLPEKIKMAYFYKFSGFGTSGIGSVLPCNSWDSFDGYMDSYKIPKWKQKKWYKWMEQFMPKFDLKSLGGTCTDFMSFLDTRYEGNENEIETTLFVKTHLKDGIVYAIQNGDIENMKILSNPAEAIDRYCEYVLTMHKTDFDFTPYFEVLEKLDGKGTTSISMEEEDLYMVEIRVAYIKGKYICNKEKELKWYEQMKWYLDFHSFENNYVKLRTDNGWLNQDNSLKYLDASTDKRIKEMIEKNEVEEIQIFSILDRGKPTGESDAVVFITFNKKEGLTTFHVWDDYTEETDMNEKINEMKLLIEPEIEEIFDWKCKNKFPYNYVKFGKKGLIPEAKIDRIYKKTTK